MKDRLGANAHPVQYPAGRGRALHGHGRHHRAQGDHLGRRDGVEHHRGPVPDGLKDTIEELRKRSSRRCRARRRADREVPRGRGADRSTSSVTPSERPRSRASIFPVLLRVGVQEQGCPGAARRCHRLPAVPVDVPAIEGIPQHDETIESRDAVTTLRSRPGVQDLRPTRTSVS